MDTTLNIDLGVIAAALAPTIAIIWAARVAAKAAKEAREAAIDSEHRDDEIHALVNDNLTREKASRLIIMQSNLALLEKAYGPRASKAEAGRIAALTKQIEALSAEITKRDAVAASLEPENVP